VFNVFSALPAFSASATAWNSISAYDCIKAYLFGIIYIQLISAGSILTEASYLWLSERNYPRIDCWFMSGIQLSQRYLCGVILVFRVDQLVAMNAWWNYFFFSCILTGVRGLQFILSSYLTQRFPGCTWFRGFSTRTRLPYREGSSMGGLLLFNDGIWNRRGSISQKDKVFAQTGNQTRDPIR